jgi:hypothetical protein
MLSKPYVLIQPDFDNVLIFSTTDHASPSPIPEMQIWVMQAGKNYPLNSGFEYIDGRIIPLGKAA